MRSQRNNLLAICLIFEAARSPSGAAAGGSSWVGQFRAWTLAAYRRSYLPASSVRQGMEDDFS